MLFARIVNGLAVDVFEVHGSGGLAACAHPDWIEVRGGVNSWVVVPDGTQHGALDNGDGTFTNPESHASVEPIIFDSADWKAYAYGVLGAIAAPEGTDQEKLLAGMARYGAILKAARASTDNMVIAALDQYDTEKYFRKDKVLRFLGVLNVNGDIVTDAELAAFNVQWPEV